MNSFFSLICPSCPASSAPSILIKKKSWSEFLTSSRIVSRILSRLVSIPPVTSSISIISIPANLPIPIIRPVSAIHAELTSYFSFKESTTGTSPAPRGIIIFAGGLPSSILFTFTGWSLIISYDLLTN